MLSQNYRIPRDVFRCVFQSGKRIHEDELTLIYAPNQLSISRFAIVVSAKVAKRAVDRNRMKRLVREAIHHLLPTIKTGLDCIVIAKTNFSQKNEQEIETAMTDLLNKI